MEEIKVQGISTQNVKSNLAQGEGRTDISDIPWYLFSRKLMDILITKLAFTKIKLKIIKNHKNLLKNGKN